MHILYISYRTIDKKFGKIKQHKKVILEIFSLMCLAQDFEEFDFISHNLRFILPSKNKIGQLYTSHRSLFTKTQNRHK